MDLQGTAFQLRVLPIKGVLHLQIKLFLQKAFISKHEDCSKSLTN